MTFHNSVMADEVVHWLRLNKKSIVVDVTLGGGGHAAKILETVSAEGLYIGIDRDMDAVAEAKERLSAFRKGVRIEHDRMSNVNNVLDRLGVNFVDAALADLGVSSFQFDSGQRGFGFKDDGPLDMRMDRSCGITAAELIEQSDESELEKVIREFGEERFAGRIARSLAGKRVSTTKELADIVIAAIPPACRHGRIHPATRVFQALRIAVNDELDEIKRFLTAILPMLAPGGPAPFDAGRRPAPSGAGGGRLVMISYHSLEDRIVKNFFRNAVKQGGYSLPFKRVLIPSEEEIKTNPRARSAKMRVIERGGNGE